MFHSALKLLIAIAMLGATVFILAGFAGWTTPVLGLGTSSIKASHDSASSSNASASLAELALDKVLQDAAPVFGIYENSQVDTSNWMSAYPDATKIVHMNIPGTHDADTWNYSLATQQSLDHVTDLVNDTEYPPKFYRCQDRSMAAMLNMGIRVFDLRYAFDVTNTTLVFWHGPGLQSETATVEDVLFGFFRWLDDHPSEALFLSFQYEGSTTMYNVNDAGVQMQLYDSLTSPAARKYFLQTRGSFGTLGEARGKITLLRRFDLDLLPSSYEATIPGVHFSPAFWTDNSPNITLHFNNATGENGTAYIEDYYQPLTPQGSRAVENIQWKLNATEAHLRFAASYHPNSLMWSFASSTNTGNTPPETPKIQALGNGTLTPKGGVNDQLIGFLKGMKGKRLGFLMFDFFEQPGDLVPLFLSLLPPSEAAGYGSQM